jgi:hypothetical protein
LVVTPPTCVKVGRKLHDLVLLLEEALLELLDTVPEDGVVLVKLRVLPGDTVQFEAELLDELLVTLLLPK